MLRNITQSCASRALLSQASWSQPRRFLSDSKHAPTPKAQKLDPRLVLDRPVDPDASESGSNLLHSLAKLTDEEIVAAVRNKTISQHKLETELKRAVSKGMDADCERAVRIRRNWLRTEIENAEAGGMNSGKALSIKPKTDFDALPYKLFDYESFYQQVLGKNCENVIGYIPVPVGYAGPLRMNDKQVYIPMATTEGALVASTNRGCRAITESGGCFSTVYNDGMTRAPVVRMPSARQCVELKKWIEDPTNFAEVKKEFDSTSNFGRLLDVKVAIAGRYCYLRFKSSSGDAMGMNMVSKGTLACMAILEKQFPEMDFLSVSGNYCTDKKPSAINWVEGRGKSVVCEAELTTSVVVNTLKCSMQSLIDLNNAKNMVGSAMAGSIGGNNAHASNIVTACFLATGQDVAQNIESSNCITLMEMSSCGKKLHVSVTMPIMEVATIGGGTNLNSQKACLKMLGLDGAHPTSPGQNATEFAKVVCGAVLAGEINLMSALASHHLVSAHMKLGRREVTDPEADEPEVMPADPEASK